MINNIPFTPFMVNVEQLLKKLSIKTKNITLYQTALTHSSFINECPNKNEKDYERLEFLGDSIINKIVTIYLYHLNWDEGEMSKARTQIVQSSTLIKAANELQLIKYIRASKGLLNNISNKMLEDCFESLIAAIYLDQGEKKVEEIIKATILSYFMNTDVELMTDHKTMLQEALQNNGKCSIVYKKNLIKKDNNLIEFHVKVWCDGICYGSGMGLKLKDAEKEAAKNALAKLVKES